MVDMHGRPRLETETVELKDGQEIMDDAVFVRLALRIEAGKSRAVHSGMVCTTRSAARKPQLVSKEFPLGLPRIREKDRAILADANELYCRSMVLMMLALAVAALTWVEKPGYSYFW